MSEKHKARVEEEIMALIAELLLRRVKDPRVANVSITHVEAAKDYSTAKILYNVVGGADDPAAVQQGLVSCSGYLRGQIGKRLRLRVIPELIFRYDVSLDRAMKIDELIEQIHREDEERAKRRRTERDRRMRDERFAKEFAEIAALVETHRRFLLFGHIDPDGDCIGSMLALAAFLRGRGKEVACFTPGDMAEIYLDLPLVKLFMREEELPSFKPDMVFALDSPTTARTADLVMHGSGVPVVNIDHHPTNERYGDINVVDERASAAAILVYRFLAAVAPERITPEMADYLYLGVLMDTGGFRFRNTNAEALAMAARFVELGARAYELAHDFIYVKKLSTLKLLARALESISRCTAAGASPPCTSRAAMLAAAGAAMSDTEGFVDYAASIDDVELAALFRELGENEIRVSLRSRNDYDVASLAEKFGGGGHRNAAGLTIHGRPRDGRSAHRGRARGDARGGKRFEEIDDDGSNRAREAQRTGSSRSPNRRATRPTTACRLFKRIVRLDKVGHAGSLDPQAIGLILILTGEATKLSNYLMDLPKRYIADIRLGATTDTQDESGRILRTGSWAHVDREAVEAALPRFTGKRFQTPPMYSALKHKGTPLYMLARRGEKIDRNPREVDTYEITLLDFKPPVVRVEVYCSRGLYLRVLAEEIGDALDVPAHLGSLVRMRIGHFTLDEAVPDGEFDKLLDGRCSRIFPRRGGGAFPRGDALRGAIARAFARDRSRSCIRRRRRRSRRRAASSGSSGPTARSARSRRWGSAGLVQLRRVFRESRARAARARPESS